MNLAYMRNRRIVLVQPGAIYVRVFGDCVEPGGMVTPTYADPKAYVGPRNDAREAVSIPIRSGAARLKRRQWWR